MDAELQRNVSAELQRQEKYAASLAKHFQKINGFSQITLELSKQKIPIEEKINSLQDSIEKKRRILIELEELAVLNAQQKGGIGKEILRDQKKYLSIVKQETKELNKQKAALEQQDGKLLLLKNSGFQGLIDKGKELRLMFKANPMAAAALASLTIFKQVWNVFKQLDEAAADFRKSMGITRSASKDMEAMVRGIAIDFMGIGVTAKDAYEAIRAIADSLGSSQFATNGMVKDMAIFAAQFGISNKTSAQFLKTMGILGHTTADAQRDMLYFAQHMSAAAGVPLDAVMEDVATASESSYQFLSRSPLELVKAAVQARAMGTSLQSATKSSASLLNFTQSVKDEMEASVLVGKSINLQRARELAYNRDIRGLNNEILKIAQQTNFENLDPFQQDAVARALGKSAGEVASMVQSAREHQKVLSAMTVEQRRQYDLLVNANKGQAKNYAEAARQEIQSLSNQKAIAAITASWHAIFANLSSVVLPKIASVLTFVAGILNGIAKLVGLANEYTHGWFGIVTLLSGGFVAISRVAKTINSVLSFFGKPLISFKGILQAILKPLVRGFGAVRGMGVGFTRLSAIIRPIASVVSRFLIPLVFAYHIFQNIRNLLHDPALMGTKGFFAFNGKLIVRAFGVIIKSLWQTLDTLLFGIPQKLLDGIISIGEDIYNGIKGPFIKAWDWLKGLFLGNSPSQLGLMIVDGIVSVEGMMIKALISPFEKAWDFIKSLPLVSKLFGGDNVTKAITPEAQATMTVDRPVTDIDTNKKTNKLSDAIGDANDEMAKRMGAIVDAINSLRDDMKNGNLTATVFIDSQKLDTAMGRRLAYTGQLVS